MDSPRLKAARNGDVHYEGSQCRKCGTTTKYTRNGSCVHCAKQAVMKKNQMMRNLIDEAKSRAAVRVGE